MSGFFYDTSAFPHDNAEKLGMSLRDWFAGKALAGMIGHIISGDNELSPSEAARLCYTFADAMLKVRER